MTQHPTPEPVAQSFADHVRAFHDSLSAEERSLLEQVFALAELAASRSDDAEGYLKIADRGSASARVTNDLSLSGLGIYKINLFRDVEGAKKL